MQPRLISQVRLPGMGHVTPAIGLGWAVTEPATATVSLFDHDLLPVTQIAVPFDDPHTDVAAAGRLIVVGDKHQISVLDHSGTVQWRSRWDRLTGNAARSVDFDLDGDDILWSRLADTKELVAIRAVTGDEIHRIPLPGPDAAWFLHRPGDTWTGLALLEPDPSPAALVGLDADRIVLRPLAGHDLAGFSPAGDRYLTMALDGFLSVRDVTTGTVIAERHLDDLPDMPASRESSRFMDRAVFLTEQLILIAVSPANGADDSEEHMLLAAWSLRCRSLVRYPNLHRLGSIHPAQRAGRWLTHHHREELLRLWHLDGRLDDEPLPGQIALL